jgi:hypothetical protein
MLHFDCCGELVGVDVSLDVGDETDGAFERRRVSGERAD